MLPPHTNKSKGPPDGALSVWCAEHDRQLGGGSPSVHLKLEIGPDTESSILGRVLS